MTPIQKTLVRNSFAQLTDADAVATLFYARLFELDPSLRPMFKGDLKEQGRKLMGMIALAVASLDQLDNIIGPVRKMGARHASYGVSASNYNTVAAALLWTLARGLGAAFTPETEAAWVAIYTLLAGQMQQGAADAASTVTTLRPVAA